MIGPRVWRLRPRSAGADWSAISSLLSDGLPSRLAVTGNLCLLSEGFERQAVRQPHEFLCHRFKLFHQGPGRLEPALSRVIFEVRCRVARRRGEC
jgi:hypothetical protein